MAYLCIHPCPQVGLSTNLNGAYHEDDAKNARVISICKGNCYNRENSQTNNDGKYTYKEKTLKLSKTVMKLRRPTQEECKVKGWNKCRSAHPAVKEFNGAVDQC